MRVKCAYGRPRIVIFQHVHPVVSALGNLVGKAKTMISLDHMKDANAQRLAGAKGSGDIVRVVNIFDNDGESAETRPKNLFNACAARL